MTETDSGNNKSGSLRWLKPLIVLLVLFVTALMSYFIINSIKNEPAGKNFTIKSVTVLPAQNDGTINLEPFIVVCRNKKLEKSKILIADIKLSFPPEKKPDVLARMFEIRSAILENLQNKGSSLRKDQMEISLNDSLKPYNIQKVTISRYDLK
jgi:flagellar basal body-associated protein FliL